MSEKSLETNYDGRRTTGQGQLQGPGGIERDPGRPIGDRRRRRTGRIAGKENDYNVSRETAAVRKLFTRHVIKTENAFELFGRRTVAAVTFRTTIPRRNAQ